MARFDKETTDLREVTERSMVCRACALSKGMGGICRGRPTVKPRSVVEGGPCERFRGKNGGR